MGTFLSARWKIMFQSGDMSCLVPPGLQELQKIWSLKMANKSQFLNSHSWMVDIKVANTIFWNQQWKPDLPGFKICWLLYIFQEGCSFPTYLRLWKMCWQKSRWKKTILSQRSKTSWNKVTLLFQWENIKKKPIG